MQAIGIILLNKILRTIIIFMFYFGTLLFWLPFQILSTCFILVGGRNVEDGFWWEGRKDIINLLDSNMTSDFFQSFC